MSNGFLEAVRKQIEDTPAGPGQKRAALKAAEDVARVEGHLGETLQSLFWRWIVDKKWLAPDRPLEWRLPDERYLSEEKIREHFPHTPYKAAVELATAAWEARVSRCAAALAAGWLLEDCLCFVCTREEWRHALKRAGRKAA